MESSLTVFNPVDQSPIKSIPLQGANEIEQALSSAHQLFQSSNHGLAPHRRIEILEKTAQTMHNRIEELIMLATSEGGKPYNDSKAEVLRAINGVKLAAQHIGHLKGEQIPMGLTPAAEGRLAFTMREPIGVVVSISAFNHPLNLIVHQAVTAIAAGCPVIIKPALTTPLSCLKLVEILRECGLPEKWCQPIVCKDEQAENLATDPRVNYLSFIGSAKVGWYLRSKIAPGTRCAMEHGGVAPVIVEADADLDFTLPALIKGTFYHAGQVCVSVQKLFVHDTILDSFCSRFIQQVQQLVVGNSVSPETEVGPLIDPEEVDRVEKWVNDAVKEGAIILCGGKRISEFFYQPTVLLNPSESSAVSTEEIFGPVACVYSYTELAEAISRANSLNVHFQASILTQNLDAAMLATKNLNAATVMINDHTAFRVDWMPFGGRDHSGIGVGGISYAMDEMTREKLVVIKSPNL